MSERLLKINKDGLPECTYCKYPEYQGQCNECEMHGDVAFKLCEYEQAEADGLLVRLPCKAGDTVYLRYMECDEPYNESHCTDWKDENDNRSCENCPHRHPIAMPYPFNYVDIPEVGKTVFLTREEAEQALKELEARK